MEHPAPGRTRARWRCRSGRGRFDRRRGDRGGCDRTAPRGRGPRHHRPAPSHQATPGLPPVCSPRSTLVHRRPDQRSPPSRSPRLIRPPPRPPPRPPVRPGRRPPARRRRYAGVEGATAAAVTAGPGGSPGSPWRPPCWPRPGSSVRVASTAPWPDRPSLPGSPPPWSRRARRPNLPWPATGQGAVSLPALGYAAQSGPEPPVPVASLTKMTTALVILHDHPIAAGASGPSVTVAAPDVAEYEYEIRQRRVHPPPASRRGAHRAPAVGGDAPPVGQ